MVVPVSLRPDRREERARREADRAARAAGFVDAEHRREAAKAREKKYERMVEKYREAEAVAGDEDVVDE